MPIGEQGQDGRDENLIWGGVKVALIPVVYGIIVYIISLIIRIVRKPKI